MTASALLWFAALLALCAAAFVMPNASSFRWAPTAAVVCGYAAWLVATNAWANASYTAAAPYHAAFLAGGFLLGRRAGERGAPVVFGTALAFAACLAIWAIAQRVGGEPRSHALFETPATLAACINLVLLPGLVLFAVRPDRWVLAAALVLLVAALAAAASRGGWIAFAAAGAVAIVGLRLAGLRLQARAFWIVVAVLVAGLLIAWLAQPGAAAGTQTLMTGEQAAESARDRLDLYGLSLRSLGDSPMWLGSGYLAFYYLVEAADPAIRSYTATPYYFVHSDYLQTLLELGVPGLAALLLMVALPLRKAWTVATLASDVRPAVIALAAGIATMAVHAAGDFPFYVPICLLMFGIALGVLDSLAVPLTPAATQPSPSRPLARAGVAAVATLMAWVLIKPALAEASAQRASSNWASMQAQDAAFWFELARRIEPRDWRYHWYAGQFWFAQAQAGAVGAAQRADAAFADGFNANPREVRNLIGRLAVQRRLRGLLLAPVDDVQLREWALRATRLAPHDPAVRAQIAALEARSGSK